MVKVLCLSTARETLKNKRRNASLGRQSLWGKNPRNK